MFRLSPIVPILAMLVSLGASASGLDERVGHPTFLSPHASPIAVVGGRVFVVNTPADTVDVIDADTHDVIARVRVGIDPVGVAVRPDGGEVWVSNHVSDSISVIDNELASPTDLQVVGTIQDFSPVTRATRFDEPVGIAFADDTKAYVALSSENRIAVVDVATRQVEKSLVITAQDPRALAVRDDRLYVIPFESNNQTQISGCTGALDGDLCTFDAIEHVVTNNNVLSTFAVVDIVRNPRVPDRDLYVFDTATDQLVQIVNGLGTLLYGLAIDSEGTVFVTQTDARNDVNGRAGTLGDGLAELGNRPFLNRITRVDCSGGSCTAPAFFDLEPVPPAQPAPGQALATPFAIAISDDDSVLVATAASSNTVFTLDAASGAMLGRVNVDAVPRGIALTSDAAGRPAQAWVLNAVANTVSLVDVANPASPSVVDTVALADPTHPVVKRGRMAFNNAAASTTGTFSCESCHPDGHTDQLLWVLDTPICSVPGCDQIPPRITMPVRGLRDTAPYHWDGIPGDPYGGNNTANIFGADPPNCSRDDPASCTRNLVDGSLATTMCQVGNCPTNDEGKPGGLSGRERDDLAQFLLSVPYPPAQRRAYTNVLSDMAREGFRQFHIEGDFQPQPNVCGDCHRMPFWVSTNTPGTGMEAPTWRGAYDRWLILPQGRVNIIDFNFFRPIAERGTPEQQVWRLSWQGPTPFNPVWNMVTEGSTGFAGAFARQVTLNPQSAETDLTVELFEALELSAREDSIVLRGEGVFVQESVATPVSLQFDDHAYLNRDGPADSFTREELISMAAEGAFVGTFTAHLGPNVDLDSPQPALWTFGAIHLQRGRQLFPTLSADDMTMMIGGRHVRPGARILVDGRRVTGNVRCRAGELPDCSGETLFVQLAALPDEPGMHFLQVQNRGGLLSNDFIFHTVTAGTGTPDYDLSGPWFNANEAGHGWFLEQIPGGPGEPDLLNAYWYVYRDGEPVWLIGLGELVEGRAELQTFVTSGGEFPPAFSPDQVELTPWGTLSFEFADDQFGSIDWQSSLDGFGIDSLNLRRLGSIADAPEACASGSYYGPDQPGHGFVAQVLDVNGETEVSLSWYVYLAGRQVWLLGQAPIAEHRAEIPMTAFSGGEFPPDFSSEDVAGAPWGNVLLQFLGPNKARVDWTSEVSGYGAGGLDLVRLTRLSGHDCE